MRVLKLFKDSLVWAADGARFAAIGHANLALQPVGTSIAPPGTDSLVCWSGWFGDGADESRGIFPRDPRTWSRAGWGALADACDATCPSLAGLGVQLCLRPHARHVLSDVQGCLTFLRGRSDVRLLLDPGALMTGSMLAHAEDHLARMFETLGGHESVAAIVLANVQRIDPEDEDALGPAPLRRGLIDPALLLRLWRAHCPAELPCALLEHDVEGRDALGSGG